MHTACFSVYSALVLVLLFETSDGCGCLEENFSLQYACANQDIVAQVTVDKEELKTDQNNRQYYEVTTNKMYKGTGTVKRVYKGDPRLSCVGQSLQKDVVYLMSGSKVKKGLDYSTCAFVAELTDDLEKDNLLKKKNCKSAN